MIDRILDFTEEPAYLRVKRNNLIIERKDKDPVSVHLPEIAALVAANKQITFTQSALAGITGNNGIVVVCDDKFLPTGMMLPVQGNSLQSRIFAQQAAASVPLKKQIWKQLVVSKVKAQGRLLAKLREHDHGLFSMAGRVRSGDSTQVEARAARVYWSVLFRGSGFRRCRDGEDQNRYLNYGYTVLRAMVTRAICSSGLHPALGVHHHNRYDIFCLSDDVMEPFRPIVDKAVFELVQFRGAKAPMDQEVRSALISPLMGKFNSDGEWRSLFDVLTRTTASLVDAVAGDRKTIVLPDI